MAEDYYKTLGVGRDASQADIQKAYRGLARKYHPDMNPGDKTAKEKFQKVQAAFDVLNDPSKRELYDRYGSSFESMGGGRGPQAGPAGGGFEDFDFSQFFGERFGGGAAAGEGAPFGDIFGQFKRGGRTGKKTRGAAGRAGGDVRSEVEIPFNTAVLGGEIQLSLARASGKTDTIAVKIPAGVDDGQTIRLRGQGEPGVQGGRGGDLLLTVHVAPHPFFHRRGQHLDVKVPVTLAEAVLGAKVDVPTPAGTISLRIPPRTSSGTKLRLKGLGIPGKDGQKGDLYAEVQIVLPENIDAESLETIRRLGETNPQNPRAELKW